MQTQNTIKMIASLHRGIFVPLVGPNEQPVNVHNFLKEKGARVSLDHVRAMMEGKETEFKDFEVYECTKEVAGQQPTPPVRPLPGRLTSSPQKPVAVSGAPAVAKGRGREYAPSGEPVKLLKRGTVYAQLMEMLVQGATMKELLESTTNNTAGGVNDVLSWQVKHRGYGLRFDKETGKYHLVFPKGMRALKYQD